MVLFLSVNEMVADETWGWPAGCTSPSSSFVSASPHQHRRPAADPPRWLFMDASMNLLLPLPSSTAAASTPFLSCLVSMKALLYVSIASSSFSSPPSTLLMGPPITPPPPPPPPPPWGLFMGARARFSSEDMDDTRPWDRLAKLWAMRRWNLARALSPRPIAIW